MLVGLPKYDDNRGRTPFQTITFPILSTTIAASGLGRRISNRTTSTKKEFAVVITEIDETGQK